MQERLHPIPPAIIEEAVMAALEEDGAYDDMTTLAVLKGDEWGSGSIVVKERGVVAGLAIAAAAMTAIDDSVTFDEIAYDGALVEPGTTVAEVEGRVASLLATERVALNFLQRMSGIATLTRDFVDAVRGTKARITDTRKTTPGLRHFERYAVRAGGGTNHRFNLSSGVLIKDNHIAVARQRGAVHLAEVIRAARAAAPHTARIEIEVTNLDEVDEAVEGGADIILLDNMSNADMREAVHRIRGRALTECSGTVTLETVRERAETGVDLISAGALTHSAKALDLSLEIEAD
jgi:nicotinate-nucleotide pyrophosphorylase (carboxylating)